MTNIHRKRGVAAAMAGFAVAAAALGMTTPVDAGEVAPPTNVSIEIYVEDPTGDAQAVIDALTPELFTDPGGVNVAGSVQCGVATTTTIPATTDGLIQIDCSLPIGDTFRLGNANPPAGFSANSSNCGPDQIDLEAIPGDDTVFTTDIGSINCFLFISPTPTLYVDKIVDGGDATASDFQIEIYRTGGSQVDIGTVTDPSGALCSIDAQSGLLVNAANCVAIPLANGSYTFGEVLPDYGYVADYMECTAIGNFAQVNEQLRSPAFDFTHSPKAPDTYCAITNTYVTDTIAVDLVVINDSGRTASGADFKIEVYDNTGALIDAKADPEPGTGNASAEFTLPLGPYTLGFSGPEGYTGTAEVVVDDSPRAQIAGAGAAFTLDGALVTATVTVNDAALVATTAAPTTAAPTTVDPNALLPATGSNSTTWTLLLVALGCIAFGGLTIAGTRRR